MIYVVATLRLRPGTRDRVLHQINVVADAVRRESGCLEYCATIDFDSGMSRQGSLRPDTVCIIERWSDLDALKAHSVAPHMQVFRDGIADAVQATDLQVLAPA